MRVLATAGHVDHGKSSLVLALTGTDPDRFAEEKRRGLTIDLGFAHTELPSGAGVSFVDVPGHVRFVANMLAGVGSVDGCLFVVDASEGWKPQSEEHLRILELLGVGHGLVALTKVDLLGALGERDELVELAALDVGEQVGGTFLAGAPVVPVSVTTGDGLDDLRRALDELVAGTPASADRGRPRLWVDRVFAARGSGTVVTGTLTGGRWGVDDRVVVEPGGRPARVRAIQTLGRVVEEIGPGHRVALNLAGVDHHTVGRGHAVVAPGRWWTSDRFDADVSALAALDHEVTRRGAYAVHLGSGEFPARLRVLGADAIRPGARGLVRIHLAERLPLLPGDRFVLRESGRRETVGGGAVLDVDPVLPATRAAPDRRVERVVAERGWVEVDALERLTGERWPATHGRWVADPDAVEIVRRQLLARIDGAGPLGLDVAGLDERERAVLPGIDAVAVVSGRARRAGTSDMLVEHPVVATLAAGGLAPPAADGLADRSVLRELARRGVLVERDGVWFHADAVDAAARLAGTLLAAAPGGFTVAEFREAAGITRKHALPLVNELDARAVTRRRGDRRLAGPRLPPA
jgi:selenocysteine-specific elongation factor